MKTRRIKTATWNIFLTRRKKTTSKKTKKTKTTRGIGPCLAMGVLLLAGGVLQVPCAALLGVVRTELLLVHLQLELLLLLLLLHRTQQCPILKMPWIGSVSSPLFHPNGCYLPGFSAPNSLRGARGVSLIASSPMCTGAR